MSLREAVATKSPLVLVVEDHVDIRGFTAAFLTRKGYEVKEVASGKEAVDMIQNTGFDVVITDQHLPGEVTGLEVLASHSRRSPEAGRILLTADWSDQLRELCKYVNAVYIEKPIPLDELVQKIEGVRPHTN